MLPLEEEELLKTLAHQAWLERGQPIGSPHIDWERARTLLHHYHRVSLTILDAAITSIADSHHDVSARRTEGKASPPHPP